MELCIYIYNFFLQIIQTKEQEGATSWDSPQLQWCEQRKGSLGNWWAFGASAENECEMVSMLQSHLNLPVSFWFLWTTRHILQLLFPWQDSVASFSFDTTCCSSLASSFSVPADSWEAWAGCRASPSFPAANSREASPYWLFLSAVFQAAWRGSLVQIFLLHPAC